MLTPHCHMSQCPQAGRGRDRDPPSPQTPRCFGWAELTASSGVLHPLHLGLAHAKGFIQLTHPCLTLSWAEGPSQAPPNVQAPLSPIQPPKVSSSVGFSLLKRIWWIYSFFKHHKSQNHLFCIKNNSQEYLQESSWMFPLKICHHLRQAYLPWYVQQILVP